MRAGPGKSRRRACLVGLCGLLLGMGVAAQADAAFDDPLFVFSPQPPPAPPGSPPPPLIPPPNGYLNGPCGLAVDSAGRLYVADHYHDAVDLYSSGLGYVAQLAGVDGPCALAVDSADGLYVNGYHRDVAKFGPSPSFVAVGVLDSSQPTGVAVDTATDRVYVDNRTHVSAYDSAGNPVLDGADPLRIGFGTLGDGHGLAVSTFPATAGYVYAPDASDRTVKVYDPATDAANPIQTIAGPPAGFVSLRDSAVAVDRVSGHVYVLDNLQPAHAEQAHGIVHVFAPTGTYLGHLKYKVVHGRPSGLAVDNSIGSTQGRVYVTSGDTHHGGIYAYPPSAATNSAPLAPTIPPPPLGGDQLHPVTPIGGPSSGSGGISCEGDNCQSLPPEPVDPTLTTLLRGLGNPKVRYTRAPRDCGPLAREARGLRHGSRRAARRARRSTDPALAKRLRARAAKLSKRARRGARAARRCHRANRGPIGRASGPSISAVGAGLVAPDQVEEAPSGPSAAAGDPTRPPGASGATAGAFGFAPGATGFGATVWDAAGETATLAGSHPYRLDITVGLEQDGGGAELRELRIDLPPGMLVNPAAAGLCSGAAFGTPRSAPFGPSSSGESCPDRSQVGTLEVKSGGGQMRRFGLFNLDPAAGAAAQLGASPYGVPLVFDARFRLGSDGGYALSLHASEVPQSLEIHGIDLALWGAPWDASHNGERGNCLNEAEPVFPWTKCSVGEPLNNRPLAFLTLPTECRASLPFAAQASTWQQPAPVSAQAVNRDPGGGPVPLGGCASLGFDPHSEGLLSTRKASSASGFVFRLTNADAGLANPRARVASQPRKAVVQLPDGVTLNPSLGAGLDVCTPAQLAAESAFNPPGAGCPNGAKIGDFRVRAPFYDGSLKGAVYLAEPYENPFGSLIAVYLIAKSAQRGMLIEAAGKLVPDEQDGTLTAVFEGLPQLPYTDLELTIRTGQRAALVSPPRCGTATTRIELEPWAQGAGTAVSATDSQIDSGIDAGPCPDGTTPPFAPEAVAGGVNSNVGSYTPYYVHLSRRDSEQEITSYSLVLPKGITGKLAGIPFCGDAAIAAARSKRGAAELASPSCPAASQVGRTLTGYGVGSALTYAEGRIYLAGPYNGRPLSLVTINAATVGPFDLGTIVIRSAFAVDPRTAQLQIDSRASDRIPHIIAGIPLHLRDIRVFMDRHQFTRNPTSCEGSELISTLTGAGARFGDPADDSSATVTEHFQLLNCLTLGFRPRLGLRLRGGVRRGAYPGLRAVFRARPGDASLKRIAVTMPRALFLAQNHIRAVCTRAQFDAERCPANSVYGRAAAHTPLFDEPLRGAVYLRSSDNKLPDLVALLRSGEVRIVLEGRIGPSQGGGIRAFFDGVPDAPVNRFTMWLRGGRRGLLVNSVNVCAAPPWASVKALGQNNRGAIFTTQLRGNCKKLSQKQKQKRKRQRQRRAQERR